MGFTVTGPNTFLGSGHPDLREKQPSRLGLIESTDAGNTWAPLSLRGQADFHTLRAIHGRVYGYESGSGTFMVSADRTRWERRSTRVIRDFDVDPGNPETVLATAAEGLIRSTDGGRTWSGVAGAPALALLAWTGPQTLFGISPDGSVFHSGDGGSSWSRRGSVDGEPAALSVDARDGSEIVYVAVGEQGIVQSKDGGTTFTTRYQRR